MKVDTPNIKLHKPQVVYIHQIKELCGSWIACTIDNKDVYFSHVNHEKDDGVSILIMVFAVRDRVTGMTTWQLEKPKKMTIKQF